MTPVTRFVPVVLFCALLAGCGGGSTSTPPPTNTNTTPPPTGVGTSSQLPAPIVVGVGQGQTVSGIDVTVAAPASSTPPNAENLGVNSLTGRASASNTGGEIHRGASMRVVLFGAGLNGQMQVSVAGSNDITISNVAAIQATDNTPGISFVATVAGNAALGARTVFLQNTNGDVTTFTGGLEVLP